MTFQEIIRQRFSVRSYEARPVEPEKLTAVLEAGRIAPSACNLQPRVFMVIESAEALAKARRCYERDWVATAPVVIVVCGRHDVAYRRADGKLHVDIDAAIAADHMTLAAVEQGLGTCWVAAFDVKRFALEFGLPPELEPIVMLPLGYPAVAGNPARHVSARKPLAEIVDRR